MSGNYKDSPTPSPQPFQYCNCRCYLPYGHNYLSQLEVNSAYSHSNALSQSMSNSTTTRTYNEKEELINKFKNLYTNKNVENEANDYKNEQEEKETPSMSDGTELTYTNVETSLESGDFLEGIQCSSCSKPMLMYTNLDFKLFENWIEYEFYHKKYKNEKEEKETYKDYEKTEKNDLLQTPLTSVDSNTSTNTGASYADMELKTEYGEKEKNDPESISDIAGSILMSSEETMFQIINAITPGEKSTNEKNQLFDSVKRFLQYCLGEDTIVHLTGSTAYDIDIDYSEDSSQCYSDLDIVLLSNSFGGDPRIILQKVYSELSNMQHILKERNKCPIWVLADSNIKLVESAKVPIVIIETKNGLLCDISVNTLYPLLHTELFKSYIEEHPMVRPLMRIIKYWLLMRKIPAMKEGGFPSILWMSLFCNSLEASNILSTTSNLELMRNVKDDESNHEYNTDKESDASNKEKEKEDTSEYESNTETEYERYENKNKNNENEKEYKLKEKDQENEKDNEFKKQYRKEMDQEQSSNEQEYEEFEEEANLSETYREMYTGEFYTYTRSIGNIWEKLQGSKEEYGIMCSLEKCFINLSNGISIMDIVNRFIHIKNGSDYGGMSLFCKNMIRLIDLEPNVPYGTWLVYYYELNRAKEYMTLYSKKLEMLVMLVTFLKLLSNDVTEVEEFKSKANAITKSLGYDLSELWKSSGELIQEEHNPLYINNHHNASVQDSENPERDMVDYSADCPTLAEAVMKETKKSKVEEKDVKEIVRKYMNCVAEKHKIQLTANDLVTNIKVLMYHMFQQFKIIPNEIFEPVKDNLYSIPVTIEPPIPIEEEKGEFSHRLECGMWDDSGWYIVVLQDRICIVKVIKICIEWDFWWSKEFVSRRDTRSIFHGFVYRQLRLEDFKKKENFPSYITQSVNTPSVLIKRGSLVLFNPCDIVSKLHVLKVVKHEQYISPSLYSTDFYTGVKCIYVLPGFEVDRFMCFEQIAHKLNNYVEFRPQVTFCKLCGILNMKKINSYTEYKIPQRKLRNAKYVLCNQKYNYIYNIMQYKHITR